VSNFSIQSLTDAIKIVLQNRVTLKNTFAPPNRHWIEAHSLMQASAKNVIEWAKEMKASYPPSK
jgi:hypothetical protein